MSGAPCLARAGRWFLRSGIQEPSGGVARYYRADLNQNRRVSTEITGYVASALAFLFDATGDSEYLDRARLTARFLADTAWDPNLRTFPFENPSPAPGADHHAYFFDCGIIVRGLVAVWRFTREDRFIDLALAASRSMVADFRSGRDFHPILALPEKLPLARTPQWSLSAGCYQTKSALAWWEVAQICAADDLRAAYLETMEASLEGYRDFLPGAPERPKVMDRLHAYSYYLEGLSPLLDIPRFAEAYRFTLDAVSRYLRDIAPEFARSDVYAQLLRARVVGAAAAPFDETAADEEAVALAGFQAESDDPRIDGAFLFGRRAGEPIPHVNPVSTAFAIQALEAWRRRREIPEEIPCRLPPI